MFAIYHFNAGFVKRSSGESTVATIAYANGLRLSCERTGKVFDFSGKQNVLSLEVMLPEGAPEFLKDKEKLANYLEEFEDRWAENRFKGHPTDIEKNRKSLDSKESYLKTAQPAQKVKVALHHDLSLEENKECLEQFLRDVYVSRGLIVDAAIHTEEENLHAHVTISRRPWVPAFDPGLKKWMNQEGDLSYAKDIWISSRKGLMFQRQKWAEHLNVSLERSGSKKRVDHRSFKDRGIELLPSVKKGWYACHLESKGEVSRIGDENRQIAEDNLKKAIANPHILIYKIASDFRYFEVEDIRENIASFFDHDLELAGSYYRQIAKELGQKTNRIGDFFSSNSQKAQKVLTLLSDYLLSQDYIERQILDDGQVRYRIDQERLVHQIADIDKFVALKFSDQAVLSQDDFVRRVGFEFENNPELADDYQRLLNLPPIFLGEGASSQDLLGEEEGSELRFSYIASEIFKSALEKGEIVEIGLSPFGEKLFSKASQLDQEIRILETLDSILLPQKEGEDNLLSDQDKSPLSQIMLNPLRLFQGKSSSQSLPSKPESFDHILKAHAEEARFALTEEQQEAVRYLSLEDGQIKVLQGRAGAGKTTIMRLVGDIYTNSGFRVRGASFQGSATGQLQRDLQRPCQTLEKFLYDWKIIDAYEAGSQEVEVAFGEDQKQSSGKMKISRKAYLDAKERSHLTEKDILIIDEANMTAPRYFERVLSKIKESGANLFLIGDEMQAKGHIHADFFSQIKQKAGFRELKGILRQREDWMKHASLEFSEHDTEKGFKAYHNNNKLLWSKDDKSTILSLSRGFLEDFKSTDLTAALTYKNADVQKLNESIRTLFKEKGLIEETHHLDRKTDHSNLGKIELGVGDRVIFTRNDNQGRGTQDLDNPDGICGVRTGDLGDILAINPEKKLLTIRLLNKDEVSERRIIQLDLKEFCHIEHGFAMTINRSEGKTFEKIRAFVSGLLPANLSYVLMTRHKGEVHAHIDQSQIEDFKTLVDKTGYAEYKPLIHSFKLEEKNPRLEMIRRYGEVSSEIAHLASEAEEIIDQALQKDKFMSFKDLPSFAYFVDLCQERKSIAGEVYHNWDDFKDLCTRQRLRRDYIGVTAGLREPLLSDKDIIRRARVKEYQGTCYEIYALSAKIRETHKPAFKEDHPEFDTLQAKTALAKEMASEIFKELKEHSKFFKIEAAIKEDGSKHLLDGFQREVHHYVVSTKTVFHHSQDIRKDQAKEALRASLSEDQLDLLESFETCKEMKAKAGTIWGEIQEFEGLHSLKTQSILDLSHAKQTQYGLLKERHAQYSRLRDAFAAKALNSKPSDELKGYLKEFLPYDKKELKAFADRHQNRQILVEYLEASPLERLPLATKITPLLSQKETKYLYSDAIRQGIDLQRLRFESGLHIVKPEASNEKQINTLYKEFASYTMAWQKSNHFRKEIQAQRESLLSSLRSEREALVRPLLLEARRKRPLHISHTEFEQNFKDLYFDLCKSHHAFYKNPTNQERDFKASRSFVNRSLEHNLASFLKSPEKAGPLLEKAFEILKEDPDIFKREEFLTYRSNADLFKDREIFKRYQEATDLKEEKAYQLSHLGHDHEKILSHMLGYDVSLDKSAHNHEMDLLASSFAKGGGFHYHDAVEILGWQELEKDHNKTAKGLEKISAMRKAIGKYDIDQALLKLEIWHHDSAQTKNQSKIYDYVTISVQTSKIWNKYSAVTDYEKAVLNKESVFLNQALLWDYKKLIDHNKNYKFKDVPNEYMSYFYHEARPHFKDLKDHLNPNDKKSIEALDVFLSTLVEEQRPFLIEKVFNLVDREDQIKNKIVGQTYDRLKVSGSDFKEWQDLRQKRFDLAAELTQEDPCIHLTLKEICGRDFRVLENAQEALKAKKKKDLSLEDSYAPKSYKTREFYSYEEVSSALNRHVDSLARQVFSGLPCKSFGHELRFGKTGKICVKISGSNQGSWHDFGTGEGGYAFNLLTKISGMNFREALEHAAQITGIGPQTKEIDPEILKRREEARTQESLARDKEAKQEKARKIDRAQDLFTKTKSIQGTVAETYLVKHRHIPKEIIDRHHQSDSLRFNPALYNYETKKTHPALMSFARNEKGEITACQAIYLTKEGKKDKSLETQKRSMGAISGSFVTVQTPQNPHNERVFIAEGLETALSVQASGVDGKILVSLGISNIKNLEVDKDKYVIICQDHDREDSPAHHTILKAKESFEQKGVQTSIIKPKKEKDDFNDVLQKEGRKALQGYFKEFVETEDIFERAASQSKAAQSHKRNLGTTLPKKIISTEEFKSYIEEMSKDKTLRDKIETHVLNAFNEDKMSKKHFYIIQERIDHMHHIVLGQKARHPDQDFETNVDTAMEEIGRFLKHQKQLSAQAQERLGIDSQTAMRYTELHHMLVQRFGCILTQNQRQILVDAAHHHQKAHETFLADNQEELRKMNDATKRENMQSKMYYVARRESHMLAFERLAGTSDHMHVSDHIRESSHQAIVKAEHSYQEVQDRLHEQEMEMQRAQQQQQRQRSRGMDR